MLCAAHWMSWLDKFGKARSDFRLMRDVKEYLRVNVPQDKQPPWGLTHVNHPCTIWTMESDANYRWHWEHARALAKEYTYRYGKTHKTERELLWNIQAPPRNIPKGPMTPFKLAMTANPECIFPDDPVKSYRAFYQTKQHRFKMVWSKRSVPEWFQYADLHAAQ